MFKLVLQAPALAKRIAPATAVAVALSAGLASAQTEGVMFVDDLEQQALRQSRAIGSRSAASQPLPYRSPSPSAQSRFPQPTVQSLHDGQKAPAKKEGWSATRSLKKTLGGLFGGSSEPAAPPKRPLMAQNQSRQGAPAPKFNSQPSFNSRPASGAPMSQVTLASAEKQEKQQPRKNPLSSWLAGDKSKTDEKSKNKPTMRSTQRSGGIAENASRKSNQPYGLMSIWSGDSSKTKRQVGAKVAHSNDKHLPANSSRLALQSGSPSQPMQSARQPKEPQWASGPQWTDDAVVAMITDSDEPTNSGMIPSSSASVKEALAASAKHATAPMPKVFGPTPITKVKPQSAQPVAAAMPQAPMVRNQMPRPMPSAGPKEIVNQHAIAVANRANAGIHRLAAQAKTAPTEITPPAAPREAAVPANPVAPPSVANATPSPKAVELLTEANRLSSSAASEADYTAVVQLCRHVLAIDASPVAVQYSHDLASWSLNRRGEVRIDQGRIKEALLDFEDALRLDPERYRAIHNRGVLAAQAGRYADAFDDFNQTIELNPKFAKAYSNRAALWVQAGEHAKASADYRQAINLDPDLAVAHKGRGHVCHVLGQFDLALQHLDAAARLSPADARIVNARGDLLSDVGRYRSAKADYQRAIELDGSLGEAYRNLAWLHATCPDRQCRDIEKSMTYANRAMELCDQPGDLEYDTLAAAHAAAGDFESAMTMMDKCLAAASDKDKPNYRWRKQLYEQGQPYVTEPASTIQQASYAE